jgi:hypothetical protein
VSLGRGGIIKKNARKNKAITVQPSHLLVVLYIEVPIQTSYVSVRDLVNRQRVNLLQGAYASVETSVSESK